MVSACSGFEAHDQKHHHRRLIARMSRFFSFSTTTTSEPTTEFAPKEHEGSKPLPEPKVTEGATYHSCEHCRGFELDFGLSKEEIKSIVHRVRGKKAKRKKFVAGVQTWITGAEDGDARTVLRSTLGQAFLWAEEGCVLYETLLKWCDRASITYAKLRSSSIMGVSLLTACSVLKITEIEEPHTHHYRNITTVPIYVSQGKNPVTTAIFSCYDRRCGFRGNPVRDNTRYPLFCLDHSGRHDLLIDSQMIHLLVRFLKDP